MKVIDYENDELEEEEEIQYIQELINDGSIWKLQGSYGRTAMQYIEAGLCVLGEKGHYDYYGNYVPSRFEVEAGTKGSLEYAQKMRINY